MRNLFEDLVTGGLVLLILLAILLVVGGAVILLLKLLGVWSIALLVALLLAYQIGHGIRGADSG